MDTEDSGTDRLKTRWFIDLDWYQQNSRSFVTLAREYLCPNCAQRWATEKGEISEEALLANISDCCCHTPGFINDRLPILESAFRLLLANNNKPLELEDLGQQLREFRGGDTYRTSAKLLFHLLSNDKYYGFRPAEQK